MKPREWIVEIALNAGLSPIRSAIRRERELGAQFERLVFPFETLRDWNVIQFSRKRTSGDAIAGLGADRNESRAYLKAVSEYFERYAVIEHGAALGFNSTNGVASHRFRALARQAACDELFERDAFLRHWYSQTPFQAADEGVCPELEAVRDELMTHGYELLVRIADLGFARSVLVFICSMQNGGFALGLSAGRGHREDLRKALIEAAINLCFGGSGRSRDSLVVNPGKGRFETLDDHRAYWLYLHPLPSWVREATEEHAGQRPAVKETIKEHVLSRKPLSVVGVASEDVLPLRIGLPTDHDRAILRRAGLSCVDVLPHPIP